MTQRIFDTDNEEDMKLLWSILPHNINRAIRYTDKTYKFFEDEVFVFECNWLRINWHDKTEITRPMQEATEQDIGKLCMFSYPQEDVSKVIGILRNIKKTTDGKNCYKMYGSRLWYVHCRRLTKQEIEKVI